MAPDELPTTQSTHDIATDTYNPGLDAFPDFDVYQAVVRFTADTLEAEVDE